MITVAGIRFRKAGKIYYFDPNGLDINTGEHVIVETIRGIEYGTIVLAGKEVEDKDIVQPLKKVLRVATEEDKDSEIKNKEREREAFEVCQGKIRKHELSMKLIDCEYTFDNNKLLFYFTADGRVDFRELVKDLASVFKTRIELRQIGVRDETKMMGSIGICGRTLCCHAHLAEFHPVSIKMAKDQNLSLNPTKISGVCGRLMCCLKYEESTYKELNKNLPRVGEKVKIIDTGEIADVIKTNIIRQMVKVIIRKKDHDPEILEKNLAELELKKDGKFSNPAPILKEGPKTEEDQEGQKSVPGDRPRRRTEERKPNKQRPSNNRNRSNPNKNKNNSQKQTANKQEQNNQKQGIQKKNDLQPQKTDSTPKPKDKAGNGEQKANAGEKKSTNSRNRNRRPRNNSNNKNNQSQNNKSNTQNKE